MNRSWLFRLAVVGSVVAVLALLASALPVTRAQQATLIGVIGEEDSPAFRALALVADKVNGEGGLTLPNGQVVTLQAVAAPATTPEEVATALQALRSQNVAAVFGPDDNTLAQKSVASLATAGVPVFIAATADDIRVGGFVFRTQSVDSIRMAALVDALVTDVRASRIAVYQGGPDFAPQTGAFVQALAKRQISPATTVLQVEGSAIADSAAIALQAQPDTVVAFGTETQTAELFAALSKSGFTGTLVTPFAEKRAFVNQLPSSRRGNIVSVVGWTYAWESLESKTFTADYVAFHGELPSSLSAAAYDGATVLVLAMREVGNQPGAILTKLLTAPAFFGLQGVIDPSLGNGEISQGAFVIQTGPNGAPRVIARFSGGERQSLDPGQGGPVAVQPTAVIPTVPPVVVAPTQTPLFVTATPEGVVLTVKNQFVNIRSGPGTVYQILGRVQQGQQLRVFGRNAGNTWYVINFEGDQAWISGAPDLVEVFGDVNTLPIVQAPPTPFPTISPTPVVPGVGPQPDIVLVGAALNPPSLAPGVPFSLTITVRNQGGSNAGSFAVAAAFKPGEKFGATIIPGLAAGQQATVVINYAGVDPGPGTYTIAIVIDLNNEVAEGDAGEANNKPTISYNVS